MLTVSPSAARVSHPKWQVDIYRKLARATTIEAEQMSIEFSDSSLRRTRLEMRNVRLGGRRTTLRLEPEMWDCLDKISAREKVSINDIVTSLGETSECGNLASVARVFAVAYLQTLADDRETKPIGRDNLFRLMRKVRNPMPMMR